MKIVYVLNVQSTGEVILTEEATDSLRAWQGRTEKKISRRVNRAQRFRDAIARGDTIAGWHNFDEVVASGISTEALQLLHDRIFRGYDNWYAERLGAKQ